MDEEYFEKRFEIFNQLRKANELCDVAIISDGKKTHGHKVVLASVSPYFQKMFTWGMVEAKKDEISIEDISYESMVQVMGFIYTTKVALTAENAQSLLLAASFLQIVQLADLCGSFVVKQIDATNCLSMRHLLAFCDCDKDIVERAVDFISDNYQQITTSEEFLGLSIDEVEGLLPSSGLCCGSEDDVLESAIRWLEVKNGRMEHVYRILKCIRLPLLSSSSKSNITENHLFQNNSKCQEYIRENIVSNPIPRKFITSVLALGSCLNGESGNQKTMIFDPILKKWSKLMDFSTSHRDIAVQSHYLYAIKEKEPWFGKYDLHTKEWTTLPTLQYQDRDDYILTLGNRIFLHRWAHHHAFLYCFDIDSNRWDEGIRSIGTKYQPAVVALDEYIYVIEGNNSYGKPKAIKINVDTKEYIEISPIIKPSDDSCGTVHKRKIYVAGSTGAFTVYNPAKDEWKELARMIKPFYWSDGLVSTENGIYALIEDVQFYDVEKNQWSIVAEADKDRFYVKSVCAIPSYYSEL